MITTFCERLKKLRLERNLSTRQLAKEINCSNIAISRWERGVQTPTIETLITLCKYFKVSANYLLGLED